MREVHVRPELADAAGHQVGVAVELRERVERGETASVLTGEAPEVEQHAVGQRREDAAHAGQIGGGQTGDPGQRLVHALEQPPLGVVLLPRRAGPGHRAGVAGSGVSTAQRLEVEDPLGPRDQPGVGDRVGGAGQQIRQAQGLAKRTGQDRQREVEAATDLAEQVAEERVTRRGSGQWMLAMASQL
jgi:hypothetical protein